MTDDDFDRVFGSRTPNHPSFTDRIARPPLSAVPPSVPRDSAVGSGPYKPYGFTPVGVGEGCEVRSWVGGTDIPEGVVFQYRFLMQVGFVGDELLRLMLPDSIVVIEGRRLIDLRERLARRTVTFIQQYSPRIWPTPPGEEAFIERIEVVRPEAIGGRS